ncbi:glycosyltransferase [Cellulomonas triticagri]|uniref:glycosyltransferase n=1 Tax=Cellulomonas triticagri TaxID=2483352 RepID=UPI0013152A6C|nr:glycosyltransferase [Cellulomonas triticagri]
MTAPVAAVVTAFRPDERATAVVRSAAAQCATVVVVDNTPEGEPGTDALPEVAALATVLRPGRNLGLAGALNAGAASVPPGTDLLLLDQDSAVPDGLVAALAAHLDDDPRTGVAAPVPWDVDADRPLDPRAAHRPPLADLPVVITSGMLVRRAALDAVGPFREDFFVDCVDQDFCLRVRHAGWRVVQDARVRLPHSLGETRWRGIGPLRLRSTSHATWRLYWTARNGTVLAREHLRREPAWVIVSAALQCYVALTVLLFEPPRAQRLATLLRGLRDGWTGRTDPRMRPGGPA